jgi:hypothetical protein
MKSSIELFADSFNKQGRPYNQASDRPVIHTEFKGDNGRWNCVVVTRFQHEHLLFLSLLPCRATPARKAACAELLTRINFGLTHGCSEMDFEDGEIRFRTSVPSTDEVPSELIEHLAFSNLWTVDRFFGTIMKVLYTDAAPKAALKPAEKKASRSRFELN